VDKRWSARADRVGGRQRRVRERHQNTTRSLRRLAAEDPASACAAGEPPPNFASFQITSSVASRSAKWRDARQRLLQTHRHPIAKHQVDGLRETDFMGGIRREIRAARLEQPKRLPAPGAAGARADHLVTGVTASVRGFDCISTSAKQPAAECPGERRCIWTGDRLPSTASLPGQGSPTARP
jgi:hypothetical protein